ncbi:MAG TPA: YceI family protein [Acidimicrobiales bacterium]|jgi:polyisoprenoid-binding protein YceI|nr:YceI family protein [Acidimicrobiales bacterium]
MTATQAQTSHTSTLPSPGTYAVDPIHSHVGFVARHLVATKVRGNFTEFEGTIVIGETPESSSVRAAAKAATIKTNQDQRDEHLRSSDFFEVETYPELTLVSKRVSSRSDGHYDLVADLTIKGTTKEVVFDLEFLGTGPGMAPNSTLAGFEATASIDRRDFGVNFNGAIENGSFVLGNKIDLEIEVQASKSA